MLLHGELARAARLRLNLLFMLLTYNHSVVVFTFPNQLLFSHLLSLIECIWRIMRLVLKWKLCVLGSAECLVFVKGEVEFESLKLFSGSTCRRTISWMLLLLCLNSRATCWTIWIYNVWNRHWSRWEMLLHRLLLKVIGTFIESETFLVISTPAQTLVIECRASTLRDPWNARHWWLMVCR